MECMLTNEDFDASNCFLFLFVFLYLEKKGVCRFLKFGFCVEMIRNIISNYNVILRDPLKIIREKFNWDLILFLVGYVGTYRVWDRALPLKRNTINV